MTKYHVNFTPRERGTPPVLLIDGSCPFCRRWGARLSRWTGVRSAAYQDEQNYFPWIKTAEFEQAIQFVDSRGDKHSGAGAVFKMLTHITFLKWPYWFYRRVPGVSPIAEWAYRFVSRRRHKL